MPNVKVPIRCWFNSKLIIDIDNKSTYRDGIVNLMIVRKSITRRELIEKLYHVKSKHHQIYLTCK